MPTDQALDIAWVLIAAALVMFMQAGFSSLESGSVRTKNSINVAAKNFADFCLSSVLFWLFGFALMFGATSGGLFGTSNFLFDDTANPWLMAFFIFQLGFCGTAVTIVSGAVSERMRFAGYLVIATILSAVIYPVIGHWVWGSASGASPGGWLEQRGFIDFAGSTVVHSVGGWIALAAIIIIGPRIGRFGENSVPIHGHDLPFVTLGVFLLWFGWFGFNGGSVLALGSADAAIDMANVFANTNSAAAGGVIAAIVATQLLYKRVDLSLALNGAIGGLVSITAEPLAPSIGMAFAIGAAGGIIVVFAVPFLEKFRIDDVVGAISAHLACGIWGTLVVPVTNTEASFTSQLAGVAAIGAFVTLGSAVVWLALKYSIGLRPSQNEEWMGLDHAELGLEVYADWGSAPFRKGARKAG